MFFSAISKQASSPVAPLALQHAVIINEFQPNKILSSSNGLIRFFRWFNNICLHVYSFSCNKDSGIDTASAHSFIGLGNQRIFVCSQLPVSETLYTLQKISASSFRRFSISSLLHT